jgi:hypothetical protein
MRSQRLPNRLVMLIDEKLRAPIRQRIEAGKIRSAGKMIESL